MLMRTSLARMRARTCITDKYMEEGREGRGYETGRAKLYRGVGSSSVLTPSEVSRLSCSHCEAVLRDPVQVTSCGCRYCSTCIEQLTRGDSEGWFTCAVDGAKYQRRDVRNDRGCLREIAGLELGCPIAPDLCTWRGKLNDIEDHYISCPLAPVECAFSQPKTEQVEMCSDSTVCCPCSGCHFEGGMSEMNTHLTTSHLFQLAQEISTTRGSLRAENLTLRGEVSTLARQVDRLLKSSEEKDAEIGELRVLIKQLLGRGNEEMRGRGDFVETDSAAVRGGRERSGGEEVDSKLHRFSETVLGLQSMVTDHGNQLEDMRIRQDITEVKTTNGVLVWKIPDVRRRYREAVERKTVSLYSPPFYTGPHSYKVCIRIYLNGDGIGKGTHISLFFFLMRSEHDNLLSWPFRQSVRFTLLNQTKPSLNISEAFVPDQRSVSFKKPQSDMNVASGFPKFACQSVLQDEGFTQDNMIFVKCQIDLSGLQSV